MHFTFLNNVKIIFIFYKYCIRQSTYEDFYHHDKLSPWGREAYQKIDLGELYILRVFIPTPKKLNFLINIFLWVGYGLIVFLRSTAIFLQIIMPFNI
jgi:hypothetical protein